MKKTENSNEKATLQDFIASYRTFEDEAIQWCKSKWPSCQFIEEKIGGGYFETGSFSDKELDAVYSYLEDYCCGDSTDEIILDQFDWGEFVYKNLLQEDLKTFRREKNWEDATGEDVLRYYKDQSQGVIPFDEMESDSKELGKYNPRYLITTAVFCPKIS